MSSSITIGDKQFKPCVTEAQLQQAVRRIAAQINAEFKDEKPLFIIVLNGAFMFGADLMKEIVIPCELSFIKLASYRGLASSGQVESLIGLNENLAGRTVIVVEDIVDSGLTIDTVIRELKHKNARRVEVATALLKPHAYTRSHAINYVGLEIGDDFVVGYGLDYNGLGRNLKEIYVLA